MDRVMKLNPRNKNRRIPSKVKKLRRARRTKKIHVGFLNLAYAILPKLTLRHLDALEQELVDALRLLHSKNISFPISARVVQFDWDHFKAAGPDFFRFFLAHNREARWASSEVLPLTWKADQLSEVKSLLSIPKLLVRFSLSSGLTPVDLASQQALAAYLKEERWFDVTEQFLNIDPVTAELAYQLAYAFVRQHRPNKCIDVLELFFGGPMALPKPGTSLEAICASFSNLRACVIETEKKFSHTILDKELEAELQVSSPILLSRFICCRAEAATKLREVDQDKWWITAMDLYDAFLASEGTDGWLERVCAQDLYNHRERKTK
ncbi:hypothetical protein F5Y10DRAFT_281973 [Nemania abortiva]|nr:hypothetical protein F5Y10DRAFT_281973 [Nemania abortiva]